MSAPIQQSHEMGITEAPNHQQGPPSYADAKGGHDQGQPQYPQQAAQPQHQYSQQNVQPQQQQQHMAYAQPGAQGQVKMVTPLNQLGDTPQDVDCPYCQRATRTRVESHASSMTIIAGILVGLICICVAWIPCAAHWCYDTEWFCGGCGAKLAYKLHDQAPVVCHLNAQNAVPSQHVQPQQQHPQQQPQPAPKQ